MLLGLFLLARVKNGLVIRKISPKITLFRGDNCSNYGVLN